MSRARERFVAVLVLVALGGTVVLASTQVFTTVRLAAASPVPVTGQGIAPALAPLGIVLIAAAAALTIAGRVARVVLGVVLVLLGAAVVLLVLPTALDPLAGTRGAVIAVTGVGGRDAVLAGERGAAGTVWPAIAAGAGVLAALAGAAVLVRSGAWPTGGRRYRPVTAEQGSTDPVDEWDALTRGADPTAGDDGVAPRRTP